MIVIISEILKLDMTLKTPQNMPRELNLEPETFKVKFPLSRKSLQKACCRFLKLILNCVTAHILS